MTEKTPWKLYRKSPEGFVNALKKPRMSTRRRVGAIAAVGITFLSTVHEADVIYSEVSTPDVGPKLVMAAGSIACKDARAMVVVYSGYGIQNGEQTAWKITSIANGRNMCTQWVDNGTDINIPAVSEAVVAAADENEIENIIAVGESVGGIEAAMVENDIVEKYGDTYKFPGLLADSTPGSKKTLKWVNPTIAQKVAEYCQFIQLGDHEMTAITLATDQNDERRNNPQEYWGPVYKATRSASMRLRTAQSCMAGKGFPMINKLAETEINYARNGTSHGDPIVDVDLSEAEIKAKANGLFRAIHMTGGGISHAAPWDNWAAYGPYYDDILAHIDEIMTNRALEDWPMNSHTPQPK